MENRERPTRPITLISIVFFALSAVSAMYLLQRQQGVSEETQAAMAAWRIANEIEESVHDLLDLEMANVEAVGPMHRRIDFHLSEAKNSAGIQSGMRELLANFDQGYQSYREQWDNLPATGAAHRDKVSLAMQTLDESALTWARQLENGLQNRVREVTTEQQRLWTDLGLGLAAVGATGGIGGMLLGFATASSMRRSILQLQVRLQDAAGKLGQDLPQFEWQFRGSLETIEEQFTLLDQHIESVVNRLQQSEREVIRADQLAKLGRVAAGLAHEIRNPLTAIKLLVQSSIETTTPPTIDDLSVIETEIRRMELSLAALLNYSRPARPEKMSVTPRTIVDGVVDLIRSQAARQNVVIEINDESKSDLLFADPSQMKQVLLNLILNALDAMPHGGRLTFEIRSADKKIRINVIDTGTGIDEDFMPQLFEPFASTKETGVGLGLALSRRLVEEQGGHLSARNLTDAGACFSIQMPSGNTN